MRTAPQTLQRLGGIVMEEYTYTEQKKEHLVLCVFDRKGNYPGEKCAPVRCAWAGCRSWTKKAGIREEEDAE